MKRAILAIIAGLGLSFLVIYAVDLEMARKDYVAGKDSSACIFKSNCKTYNLIVEDKK